MGGLVRSVSSETSLHGVYTGYNGFKWLSIMSGSIVSP